VKIIALQAENVKKLSAVYIEPKGPLVEITGKNGAGKSSVLDSIFYALAGDREIAKDPIRHGQERARIVLDCGDLIVTRTFKAAESSAGGKPYTTTISVERADGSRLPKPQAQLDDLLGEISFDPLVFERAKPDERFEMIRRLMPDINFDEFEKAQQIDGDARTEIGRKAKELHARAGAVLADMSVGDDERDIGALEDELAKAAQHNSEIEQRKNRRTEAEQRIKWLQDQAREARAKAERLRKEADDEDDIAIRQVAEADKLEERLAQADELPQPIDIADVRRQMDEWRTHNAKVVARRDRLQLQKLARDADDEYDRLTNALALRKRELHAKMASSEFPVQGVTFEDRAVFLNGVPYEQASQAESLKCAIEIAMALNPKLRILRIKDGSRLDPENIALIAEIARERDFQCWIETVASDRDSAIVIEDGHIRGEEPESKKTTRKK
jgi:DNA repair exonuclease SbcCD ATPase subunit